MKVISERWVGLGRIEDWQGEDTARAQLLRLGRVEDLSQLGDTGGLWASMGLSAGGGVELHRFEALFGRDSLITSELLLSKYPKLMRCTILDLASLIGLVDNPHNLEEPGRVIHEHRRLDDPIAIALTKNQGWSWPYYGSNDATLLWIRSVNTYRKIEPNIVAEVVELRDGRLVRVSEVVEMALGWVRKRLRSPSGAIESKLVGRGVGKHHLNQVWKDSYDSYQHKDGCWATPFTRSSIEIVGLTYDALGAGAEMAEAGLIEERAGELRELGKRQQEVMLGMRSVDGWFGLGLDRRNGAARVLEVHSSNVGWLLDSGIVKGEEWRPVRETVVGQLFDEGLWCESGVRTFSKREVGFGEGSYRLGSVWAFDQAIIARGLWRNEEKERALQVSRAIIKQCDSLQLFPELVRGKDEGIEATQMARRVRADNGRIFREPAPQEVQAWTVAAYLFAHDLLQQK